ncbi:MAG: hypothetical protein CSA58_02465 [Micrococcales bacterium]|nr:MAG: hypothetical protein CSA58_02465 [Micrococcales bacterium]
MMLATATAMIRGRRDPGTSQTSGRRPIAKIVLEGVVVGFVTGLVGAGGGFLVVPALVLLGGLPMAAAVSTSLMVVSMNCFAALFGYLSSVQIDWSVALSVTAAALVGSVFGGMLVGRVHADSLRKGFGWFVLVMGSFILVRQLLA